MKSTNSTRVALFLILSAGGCVVGDELTTVTMNPDGSRSPAIASRRS